jgi:hypothetical protein
MDKKINLKIEQLKKSKERFGLSEKFFSEFHIQKAIEELNFLRNFNEPSLPEFSLPVEMLEILLIVTKKIYSGAEIALKENGGKNIYMSADDFIPIFIYVVVQSDVKNLNLLGGEKIFFRIFFCRIFFLFF